MKVVTVFEGCFCLGIPLSFLLLVACLFSLDFFLVDSKVPNFLLLSIPEEDSYLLLRHSIFSHILEGAA